MRITEKLLLEKVARELVPAMGKKDPDISAGVKVGAIAAARALGYEVVEEPELPERINAEVVSSAWQIGRVGGPALGAQYPLNPQEEALLRELALRYNTKKTVMRVADRLHQAAEYKDGSRLWLYEKDFQEMERQLRAAYEEEKP